VGGIAATKKDADSGASAASFFNSRDRKSCGDYFDGGTKDWAPWSDYRKGRVRN